MDKHQSKITILICLLVAGVVGFFALRPRDQAQTVSTARTAPPIPVAKADQPTTVGAPDGKMSLTMRMEKGKETTTYTYTFLVKNEATSTENQIYTKTVLGGTTISIPQNTFSPDDKYIFLKEASSSKTSYFVITTSGAPVTKDAQTLDIPSLFAEKYPDYKIADVTGWGGMTLLVINTDKNEGGKGPSFWLDVTSSGFTQLSNRFN